MDDYSDNNSTITPASSASIKKKKQLGLKFANVPNQDQNKSEFDDLAIDLGKMNSKDDDDELSNLQLSDLKKIDYLGQGASAIVEKMEHIPTGKFIALKVIHLQTDEGFKKALKLELDTLMACKCENIVKCYGAFTNQGTIKIALEYMDLSSLASITKATGKIPEVILGKITAQCLNGLHYLHKNMKVIHRDIKPQNILVNSEGQVKIADFGVSGQLAHTNELKSTWVGTTIYMSPERIKAENYTADTDIWSLGLTLFECAIGKFPIQEMLSNIEKMNGKKAEFWDLVDIIQNKPIEFPSEFSPEFKEFLSICLRKESGTRLNAYDLQKHKFVQKYIKVDQNKFKGWMQNVYTSVK